MKYRIAIDGGQSGRVDHLYEEYEFSYKVLRFHWWFWLPNFRRNDGRFKLKSQCVEFTINWLCFWVSIYFWRKTDASED